MRLVAGMLIILGWLFILYSPGLFLFFGWTWKESGELVYVAVAFLSAVPVLGLGFFLARLGKRLSVEDAIDMLRHDPRPPVLYLRAFAEDGENMTPRGFERDVLNTVFNLLGIFGAPLKYAVAYAEEHTDEEWLESLFGHLGPMVAIGMPGEQLRYAGAARVYTGTEWQRTVGELMARARLVLLRIGRSPGLDWEINEAVRVVSPERVVFYLTLQKDRKVVWDRVRDAVEPRVSEILPPNIGKALFLTFGADWTQRFIGSKDEPNALTAKNVYPAQRPSSQRGAHDRTRLCALGYWQAFAGFFVLLVTVGALEWGAIGMRRAVDSWGLTLALTGLVGAVAIGGVLAKISQKNGLWYLARFAWTSTAAFIVFLLNVALLALAASWFNQSFFGIQGDDFFVFVSWFGLGGFLVFLLVIEPWWSLSAMRKEGLR